MRGSLTSGFLDYDTRSVADLIDYCPEGLGQGYIITRINVPPEHRGKGIGSQLLKAITDEADVKGVRLYLEINPYGGLTYDQLEAWYMRHGFKHWPDGASPMYRRTPRLVQRK